MVTIKNTISAHRRVIAFPHSPARFGEKGFSLPELLVVIAVFTVIASASYPAIRNFSTASAYSSAQAKAETLTAAKIFFYKNDPEAESDWTDAATNSAKFDLLLPYLQGLAAGTTIESFAAPPPYNQFDLGAEIKSPVTIIEST